MRIVAVSIAALVISTTRHSSAAEPEAEIKSKYERSSFDLRLGVGPWTSTLERENQGLAGLLVAFDMQFRVSLAGSIVLKGRYGRIHWDAGPYGGRDDALEMTYFGPVLRFQFLETGPVDVYADLISIGLIRLVPLAGGDCGASSGISTFPGLGANWFVSQSVQFGAQIEYALGGWLGGCTSELRRQPLPNPPENPGILQMNLGLTWLLGGPIKP